MDSEGQVRRAQSCAADTREAARAFHDGVAQPDMALVVFFCSVAYDLEILAEEIKRLFGDAQVIGCTTAGEIGPVGYRDASISGASFPAGGFTAVCGRIDRLQHFDAAGAQRLTYDLMQRLESLEPGTDAANTFGLLLVDGMSGREEPLTRALQGALGATPLVGGSAADGLRFASTHVYFAGGFHTDSAVLALVTTPLPFRVFKTQHFVPTTQRVVVTAADAEHRIIQEIDGEPAVKAYARLVGASIESLDPMSFPEQPMVVQINGTNYVRAIQKANPDGSLTLFCAIEEGLVLRVARGSDLMANLTETFAGLAAQIGRPQVVIGFDCLLRKLEMTQHDLVERVEAVFRDNNATGFTTFGEQFHGVHVNQTLTGIAIGRLADG